jgi:hypothetical protein
MLSDFKSRASALLKDAKEKASNVPVAAKILAGATLVAAGGALWIKSYVNQELGLANLSAGEWAHVSAHLLRSAIAQATTGAHTLDVTAPMLQDLLAKEGLLKEGSSVSSAEVVGLDNNRGLRGCMLRVNVGYSDGVTDVAGKNPSRLVLKTVLFNSIRHRYDMLLCKNYREGMLAHGWPLTFRSYFSMCFFLSLFFLLFFVFFFLTEKPCITAPTLRRRCSSPAESKR